jgi:hypothetical protein
MPKKAGGAKKKKEDYFNDDLLETPVEVWNCEGWPSRLSVTLQDTANRNGQLCRTGKELEKFVNKDLAGRTSAQLNNKPNGTVTPKFYQNILREDVVNLLIDLDDTAPDKATAEAQQSRMIEWITGLAMKKLSLDKSQVDLIAISQNTRPVSANPDAGYKVSTHIIINGFKCVYAEMKEYFVSNNWFDNVKTECPALNHAQKKGKDVIVDYAIYGNKGAGRLFRMINSYKDGSDTLALTAHNNSKKLWMHIHSDCLTLCL